MLIALVVLVTIGAFFIGITTAWLAKGYVEDYIENAAYVISFTSGFFLNDPFIFFMYNDRMGSKMIFRILH